MSHSGRFIQVKAPDIKSCWFTPNFRTVPVVKSVQGFSVDLFTPTEKLCSLSPPEINDGVRQRTEWANREWQTDKGRGIERDCSISIPKLIDSLLTGPSSIDRSVNGCCAVAYTEV